jgi:hypothetical protein
MPPHARAHAHAHSRHLPAAAQYCRALRFDDKPDFSYLRKMFRELFTKEGYQWDYVFDWTILKHQQTARPTSVPDAPGPPGEAEGDDSRVATASALAR